jgi:hypothetical protein
MIAATIILRIGDGNALSEKRAKHETLGCVDLRCPVERTCLRTCNGQSVLVICFGVRIAFAGIRINADSEDRSEHPFSSCLR